MLSTRIERIDNNMTRGSQIMIRILLLSICIAVSPLVLPGVAIAEEDQSFPMVEEWVISAKAGSEDEFMDALKAHATWRRDNGDPWTWNIYTPQTGRMDTGVLIRSTDHSYSDIATYGASEFNQKAVRHWDETVAPYTGVATRYLRFQTPVRYWPDENYDYLLISQIDSKPDSSASLIKAAAVLHDIVREAGLESVGGLEYTWAGGGPAYQYVDAYKDWESTSPGSPLATEMNKLIVEKLGEEKANTTYEAAHIYHTSEMRIYKRLE
jgi:hypothetical protein